MDAKNLPKFPSRVCIADKKGATKIYPSVFWRVIWKIKCLTKREPKIKIEKNQPIIVRLGTSVS